MCVCVQCSLYNNLFVSLSHIVLVIILTMQLSLMYQRIHSGFMNELF